jgi:hypothetical protein
MTEKKSRLPPNGITRGRGEKLVCECKHVRQELKRVLHKTIVVQSTLIRVHAPANYFPTSAFSIPTQRYSVPYPNPLRDEFHGSLGRRGAFEDPPAMIFQVRSAGTPSYLGLDTNSRVLAPQQRFDCVWHLILCVLSAMDQ